jgi:hypothetical protein
MKYSSLKLLRRHSILLITMALTFNGFAQTPLEQNKFLQPTSYDQLKRYVTDLDQGSDLLKLEVIGKSAEERNIYALLFSSGVFGQDEKKTRVLIFAQQHGNEQSGKEGALLLAAELIKPANRGLFNKLDLALIPQVNPDGSEVNRRRNANDADLNRNHLILTQPETQALHRFFDRYLFEVTMDVHEYSPYSEDWKAAGFRKNSEVTVGTTTNPDVSARIRKYSKSVYLPYIINYLNQQGHSAFEYSPGDPPGQGYTRHSTFDINDGRQSFGILNTFSLIQEGMNGEDNFIERIEQRAEEQKDGMMGLLLFVNKHARGIKKMVDKERAAIPGTKGNKTITLQSEHVADGRILELPVFSYASGKDSVVKIRDYRPVVRPILTTSLPYAYLIPAQSQELIEWADRHRLEMKPYIAEKQDKLEQYFVKSIDSIDFEGDIIVNPVLEVETAEPGQLVGQYYEIPVSQFKGRMLAIALEPKSMLGLITYPGFAQLLKTEAYFPVIRKFHR